MQYTAPGRVMPELQQFPLVTTSGKRGRLYRTSRFLDAGQETRVTLEDGAELFVPSEVIRPLPDGSFLLDEQALDHGAANGVGSITRDEPLFQEDVEVERIPVNRFIDGPVETRQEGDLTIVPVVEEVLTVQKRLLLKEEVHIRRRRAEVREPRRVVLHGGEPQVVEAAGRPARD